MPLDYRIDHARRLLAARASGVLTDQDVFDYQRGVCSRLDVTGFDELVDMTQVESIALPSAKRVHELASLSAAMDSPVAKSKFAVVAPADIAFGIGRMYETHRNLDPRTTKHVGVFRTLPEAMAFLGIEARLPAGHDLGEYWKQLWATE